MLKVFPEGVIPAQSMMWIGYVPFIVAWAKCDLPTMPKEFLLTAIS